MRAYILNIHIFMVSHIRKKVEILIPTNVIMLITIKLFKLIDRFIPFWWEEELREPLDECKNRQYTTAHKQLLA